MSILLKTILLNPHVKFFKSDRIRIERPEEGVIHCDGDPLVSGRNIEVRLIGRGLRVVVCPPEMKKQPALEHAFESSVRQIYDWQQQMAHGREQLGRLGKASIERLKKK